ncbi:unnamed protein product [Arabidopsis thaliana]|uniref:(thale cress) hypothetical protein n=1 Tax=Arabidopsis thaliana TaxID=3702 RepID=A0A7G2DYI9_ARATH|nr:unnamed protein product [Arabidopsis thaliana]
MEEQYEKKITWTIKNFSSLPSDKIYSDYFVVGDSKWRLLAYPKGNGYGINKSLSLFLDVADSESLPDGWKRHIKYRLTVVNQKSEKLSKKIVETPLVNESIDINGFQVLPSQVESVNSLFEDHPDIASNFRLENPLLRTQYMNSLLHLTEILCQSPQELSNVDLANAYSTLSYVTKAGFKLDWLEKKLKEIGETRVQEIREELKDMKQKCADMEALLEFLR